MKKKTLLISLILSMCAALYACAGSSAPATADGGEQEIDDTPVEISQKDADSLLAEKLDGLKVKAIFDSIETAGEDNYYTYTAVDSDNNELEQKLAVNTISGEIFVYLPNEKKLQGFETFSYYDKSRDEEVSWEGSFELGGRTVSLEPADTTSFEFEISKNGKTELAGVASGEGRKARYEDDKYSLTFERKGDNLEITDSGNMSGFAGIYEIKNN